MTSWPSIRSALGRVERARESWTIPGSSLLAGRVLRDVVRKSGRDGAMVLAGNIAFRLLFAFIPALISILWLLRVVHADPLVGSLSDILGTIVPGQAHGPLQQQIQQAPQPQESGAFTLGVAFSLAIALWAITEAFRATTQALNVVYGVREERNSGRRLLLTLGVSALTVMLFVVATVVIVSGTRLTGALTDKTGIGITYEWIWAAIAWLVVAACVLSAITLLYYFAPDVEQRLRWVRAGSLLAVSLWLLFSGMFSLYVNRISRPDQTYGALAGVAVFMVYLYGSALILLVGAELNQVIEHGEPGGKSTGEWAPDA